MAKILIYNNQTNRMETYYRGENEAMPYNNGTLKVKEFRGSSQSNLLWTDRRTMQSWNNFRTLYGRPIYVGFVFKRCWEGGHGILSQHYAGVAFDVGQNLNESSRNYMRTLAKNSGYWRYVEPANLTPRWVHFDNRWIASGYPLTLFGSRGIYVLIAQDALNTLGLQTGGLDGIFGNRTQSATITYQGNNGLNQDGKIGPITWNSLMSEVVGKGATGTTILE
ncbi:MAG: peptidoglycan-binding protein [Clostridia bacterium]|nr:peptidoglycan-binding protein [Clostridia bacterium]